MMSRNVKAAVGATFNLKTVVDSYSIIERTFKNDLTLAQQEQKNINQVVESLFKEGNFFVNLNKTLNQQTLLKVGTARPPIFG
jgi:hypothetical protein